MNASWSRTYSKNVSRTCMIYIVGTVYTKYYYITIKVKTINQLLTVRS